MLASELYIADDPDLAEELRRAAVAMERFNASSADRPEERQRLLGELLGEVGDGTYVRPPLHVDYGYQTTIGPRTFVNFGAVLLDVAGPAPATGSSSYTPSMSASSSSPPYSTHRKD